MTANEVTNLSRVQNQIKNCSDFFEVVATFQADGCSNDRAVDLACQLLEIEKNNISLMTGTIKLKYKNFNEQSFNVVMPLNKNKDQLTKLVHEHLKHEIQASYLINPHTSPNNLENLLPYLSYIVFDYHDLEETKNKFIEIEPMSLL